MTAWKERQLFSARSISASKFSKYDYMKSEFDQSEHEWKTAVFKAWSESWSKCQLEIKSRTLEIWELDLAQQPVMRAWSYDFFNLFKIWTFCIFYENGRLWKGSRFHFIERDDSLKSGRHELWKSISTSCLWLELRTQMWARTCWWICHHYLTVYRAGHFQLDCICERLSAMIWPAIIQN